MLITLLIGAPAALHYLTCRHGYEPALLTELERSGFEATSPCAAVVRVAEAVESTSTYALQVLPYTAEVRAASIKALATAAASQLGAIDEAHDDSQRAMELLRSAPRGGLLVQALVPDILRGV